MKSSDDRHRARRRHTAAPRTSPPAAAAAASVESYLSLTSRAGAGTTRPFFVDGPIGLAGLDVVEPLFRFDANVHLPTRERGVTSANRVGEPLATLHMQWRPIPDDFDGVPDRSAPATELRANVSQRFVMHSATIVFHGRTHGALRFHGSGRTYPATTDGQARLLFAGAATIVDGTGGLTGARGTLMIAGDVLQSSAVSLTVVGRFDAGSPVSVEDTLEPLRDLSSNAQATVLTLVGDDGPDAERLRVARIGNDLSDDTTLRSLFRVGTIVGSSRPAERGRRVITFTDPAGVQVGSIMAVNLEGTPVAYGPVTYGTGALTGAGGVLTLETVAGAKGVERTLYLLRLADPKGRFQPPFADVYKPLPTLPAADAAPEPASVETLKYVDGPEGTMGQTDRAILRYVERSLADGAELALWWEEKDRARSYAETFDLSRDRSKDAGRSFGFFDTAAIANTRMPVMGVVQEMVYDRHPGADGQATRDQLKEFVLRYFMRVSHLGHRGVAAAREEPSAGALEKAMEWLPGAAGRRGGPGYQQRYYKRRDSSQVGKFGPHERAAIVDLRDIGSVYDWIVLESDEATYLVIGPPFIRNIDNPAPGVLGHYGFGYALLPYDPDGPGVLTYSPGHFAAAIQQVDFTVLDSGEIRVRTAFVVNRPARITKVDLDPIEWGFTLADVVTFGTASRVMAPVKEMTRTLPLRVNDLDPISAYIWMANAVTNGVAGRRLGHSKAAIEKRILARHFRQHRALLSSSLLVWRMVADWMDEDRLPAFCREGVA